MIDVSQKHQRLPCPHSMSTTTSSVSAATKGAWEVAQEDPRQQASSPPGASPPQDQSDLLVSI